MESQKEWQDERRLRKRYIKMVDLSFLTNQDLKILYEKADFSDEQIIILKHLQRQDMTDDGIMLQLGLSRNKYYKIKTNLINKIIRIAVQN